MAFSTAWVRVLTSIFLKMWWVCVLTVFSLKNIFSLIAKLDSPEARACRISISRLVRLKVLTGFL